MSSAFLGEKGKIYLKREVSKVLLIHTQTFRYIYQVSSKKANLGQKVGLFFKIGELLFNFISSCSPNSESSGNNGTKGTNEKVPTTDI